MNPKVDEFLGRATKWQEEMTKLRNIILDCGLMEELKWGKPAYTFNDGNVLIIQGFKEYCAILFVKGVLLSDAEGVMQNVGENSQSAKQIRFTNIRQIFDLEQTIKTYVYEAIEVEKAGLKVPMKKTSDYPIPDEFQQKLDSIPALKTAFEGLTPGRQRAYILHFSQPKQSKTRLARVEKYIPVILSGKGLNDN